MCACHRARDRGQTEQKQNPMENLHAPERTFRITSDTRLKRAVQKQRLRNEEHKTEDGPDKDHRVHPPV